MYSEIKYLRHKKWVAEHRDSVREYDRIYGYKERLEVLRHYSPDVKCHRCGNEDERVLVIDHTKGGGTKLKNSNKMMYSHIYRWLKLNNYPADYQVLCMNCNWIKRCENNETSLGLSFGRRPRDDKWLRRLEQERGRKRNAKMSVIRHYSPSISCQNCSNKDIRVLTIDHIKGQGMTHLRKIGIGSLQEWLIKNGFPDGFQVLCWNCQHKKARENHERTGPARVYV